jgi:hypothetical protein
MLHIVFPLAILIAWVAPHVNFVFTCCSLALSLVLLVAVMARSSQGQPAKARPPSRPSTPMPPAAAQAAASAQAPARPPATSNVSAPIYVSAPATASIPAPPLPQSAFVQAATRAALNTNSYSMVEAARGGFQSTSPPNPGFTFGASPTSGRPYAGVTSSGRLSTSVYAKPPFGN